MKLENNEKKLGNWTLNYLPKSGGRYLGKLIITDKRVVFETQYDMSAVAKATVGLAGVAAAASALGLNKAFVRYEQNMLNIDIPRQEIKDVRAIKKVIFKRVIVVLKDGSEHTFDNGVLATEKIVEALK